MNGPPLSETEAPGTFDRDWVALLACAAGLIFSVGAVTIYPLGVFMASLTHDFGWTRGQISGAATTGQISLVLSSLLWGLLLDRFGPRRILLSAVSGLALGLVLFSRLTAPLWHLYALFIVIPLLAAAANPLGYNAVIVRRFSRRLGLALGIALMGVGFGAALLPPISQRIIAASGWRSAYVALAGVTILVGLPAAWVATRNAGDRVLRRSQIIASPLLPLLRTRTFLLICATFFLLGTAGTGVLTHLIPMMTDQGISASIAAKIAGIVGISTLVSRGVVGWLLDRLQTSYMVAAIALICAGLCVLLIYGGGPRIYSLAAIMLGLVAGAEVDFIGFLVRKNFSDAAFGRLYAIAFAAFALGPGAVLIGYSYDHFHNYGPGLELFALLSLLAAALAFALPRALSTGRMGENPVLPTEIVLDFPAQRSS